MISSITVLYLLSREIAWGGVNLLNKKQRGKELDQHLVSIFLDDQISCRFDELHLKRIPIDLSPNAVVKMGAEKLLEIASAPPLSHTPIDILKERTERLAELSGAIAKASNELNELHSARAVYADDEIVVEYYLEIMEKIVERMQKILKNDPSGR